MNYNDYVDLKIIVRNLVLKEISLYDMKRYVTLIQKYGYAKVNKITELWYNKFLVIYFDRR